MATQPTKGMVFLQLHADLQRSWRQAVFVVFCILLGLSLILALDTNQAEYLKALALSGVAWLGSVSYLVEVWSSEHYVAPLAYLGFMLWVKHRQSRETLKLIPQVVADEPDAAAIKSATRRLNRIHQRREVLSLGFIAVGAVLVAASLGYKARHDVPPDFWLTMRLVGLFATIWLLGLLSVTLVIPRSLYAADTREMALLKRALEHELMRNNLDPSRVWDENAASKALCALAEKRLQGNTLEMLAR